MPSLGSLLIRAKAPEAADIAVVLAGDYYGRRILKGAELVRQGYVSKVLISGPKGFYGSYESEYAIAYAVEKGFPREWFIPFHHSATSTEEEAAAIIPELRRMRVQHYLLVTSDYHTGRAGRIFRRHGRDLQVTVVAAPDESFHAESWWKSREGRKTFYMEWSKTVATALGL
jgi:uncharacterized SAM-binding protein YcdF (DUF218 family)